uniref:Uncharacterized protein n=1 Tax=Osugoroshi virus TaxID=2202814 RepID=A0A7R7T1N3_9VIRU|nr:hypothetical protein [Osugoroshi virus]
MPTVKDRHGAGCKQRKIERHKNYVNTKVLISERNKRLSALLGFEVCTTTLDQSELSQVLNDCFDVDEESTSVAMAIDAFESDPFIITSVSLEEISAPLPTANFTFHEVHEREESTTCESPNLCDDNHTIYCDPQIQPGVGHVAHPLHDVRYSGSLVRGCKNKPSGTSYLCDPRVNDVKECDHKCNFERDTCAEYTKCVKMKEQLNYSLVAAVEQHLPQEMKDLIYSNLSCREKFLLSVHDGIPRSGCSKRVLVTPPPRYDKIPPYLGCTKILDRCICESVLYKRPERYKSVYVRSALHHTHWMVGLRYSTLSVHGHVGRTLSTN